MLNCDVLYTALGAELYIQFGYYFFIGKIRKVIKFKYEIAYIGHLKFLAVINTRYTSFTVTDARIITDSRWQKTIF